MPTLFCENKGDPVSNDKIINKKKNNGKIIIKLIKENVKSSIRIIKVIKI